MRIANKCAFWMRTRIPWMNDFLDNWLKRILVITAILMVLSYSLNIGINLSPSLPNKLFITNEFDKKPKKGGFVEFKWDGSAYPKGLSVVKIVTGMPGDVVTEKNREFFINGISVGKAKTFSLTAESLVMNRFRGKIPPGMMWVSGTHKDSFDSRYHLASSNGGLIRQDQIVGVAHGFW